MAEGGCCNDQTSATLLVGSSLRECLQEIDSQLSILKPCKLYANSKGPVLSVDVLFDDNDSSSAESESEGLAEKLRGGKNLGGCTRTFACPN
jgi:hypothetical protein